MNAKNYKQKNLIERVVSLTLIVLAGFVVTSTGYLLFALFPALDDSVKAAIIAAFATILVSVFSIIVSKNYESKQLVEQDLRNKRVPVYEKIMDYLYGSMWLVGKETGETVSPELQKQLEEQLRELVGELIIWGSDDVILKFRSLKNAANIPGFTGLDMVFMAEDLYEAVRIDLGYKNKGFKRGTLLGLYVNDIDTELKK